MEAPNQFELVISQAVQWARAHQERFWAITGGGLLSIVFFGLVIHHQQVESEDAWTQLGTIQGQVMQGKLDESRKTLDDWLGHFQRTSAGDYAQFMKADLLYRASDFTQAAKIYGELAHNAKPALLRPLALSAEVSSEEMAGHIPQAQALAQTFLDTYPDHFGTGPMYITQARLAEMAGNSAAAAVIYNRYVLLFPQSPWTALARSRTQALGAVPTLPSASPAAALAH